MDTPGQDVFGKDILFNLAAVVDWRVVTAAKQRQEDIDNVIENTKWVTHDYTIGNQVYLEITGIYCKPDYRRQGPYRITEVFTKGTFRVQRRQVNEIINIIRLKPHFN